MSHELHGIIYHLHVHCYCLINRFSVENRENIESLHDTWQGSTSQGWNHASDRNKAPGSKVHEANMGPTWGLQYPGGSHVGLMNLAIRGNNELCTCTTSRRLRSHFGANASRFILYFDSSEYMSDPYMVDMLWTVTNPKLKCIISSTTIGICWRNVELQQIVKTHLPQLPHIYVSESGQKWFR